MRLDLNLTADITYHQLDSMFTAFFPNTPSGVAAWNKIAAKTDGTGKVLNCHVQGAIRQLRKAGYSVSKRRTSDVSADALLAELMS